MMLSLMVILFLFTTLPFARAQDVQAELEAALTDLAADDGAAVVVQVSTPQGAFAAAAGLADESRPAQTADRFRIGSMSKTFVAALALMLAEDGLFALDDPARQWLPQEVTDRIANADRVTLQQLLAMRSGIDDYLDTEAFWETVSSDPAHRWTAAEALTYAYDLDPLFAPGEDYAYSNTNYLLMQLVIEKASGRPLHQLLRERILDPLNLRDTYTQMDESLPGGFVEGYEDFDGDGEAEAVNAINDGAGLADGGLVSTAADLTAFYRALLLDQTLLSAASQQELLDFQPAEGEGYSLGLGEWETDYGPAHGHSGAVLGFVSNGFYLPDQQTIVIVLAADADFDIDTLSMTAVAAVLESME